MDGGDGARRSTSEAEESERPAPTLSDVARAAGVSLATADRVLNRRPGVRLATVEKVEAAMAALRFERHPGAAALARRARFRVAALLPRGSNPFMLRLRDELERASRRPAARALALDLMEVDTFDPAGLAAEIERAGGSHDAVLAVGLDHPTVAAAIDAAGARGVPVVTLVSDVPGSARARYVGVDNRAAGRVAAALAGRLSGSEPRSVAVLLGARALRDHRDRLDGFQEVLAARYPLLRLDAVMEGQDDPDLTKEAVRRFLHRSAPPAAIYSAGAGNAGLAAALSEYDLQPLVIAHELTAETRPLIESGAIDVLIVQDPGHEARSALRALSAELTGTQLDEAQERIRIEILMKDNLP
ncbi:LacI family DNA-binding transcriptional regulator [Aureimonas sp. AU40]|uniref:LacI family DNA-binding transcriptional regulator n=1 Tax=Aureimonas sp. AU40 TaxID=1637747 RepID=UPI00078646AF|nr:LacI family DNA-binding transcriptional regulator [Aureimonas sp. AU40]